MSDAIVRIYSGLTLGEAEIRRVLPGALVAPPIRRRDLKGDIERGVHVVGIIDGTFHQSLAVSPGEIMDAMRAGLKVYGASSMGAMRAAELAPYGMVGVGRIFEHIRGQLYFRDDFLGQAFSPCLQKVVALPFIDLYFNVKRLEADGRLAPAAARALIREYERMHYLDRSGPALMARLAAAYPLTHPIHAAARRALGKMGSQKRRDALELLRTMRRDLARVARINAALARTRPRARQHLFARPRS
jgi:ribosomal protein S12 methylthiotransferase accessory factor